jgi:predicted Zn-dependent protease
MIARNSLFHRLACLGVAAGLALAVPYASAQDEGQDNSQGPHISEKTSDALQKLKPLQESKNYAGMMDVVNTALNAAAPTSYDAAYLLDLKARLYVQINQIPNAIEPWEQALKLSDQFKYFDAHQAEDIAKYLAELIFSNAIELKDKNAQEQQIAQSATYLKRYLSSAKKPEAEVQTLYAQILYYQATFDPNHINQALLKQARDVIEQGMLGSIRPKESFYRLLLAILQQENDYTRSAEIMELMVKEFPTKKDIWPALFSMYINLAGTEKLEKHRREYYVRAINTMERAQSLGFMNAPRDNYNLVTVYINAGEYGVATDLLQRGLEKGTIESTPTNWKILGSYYLQVNKEMAAARALEEACRQFPQDGSLELQLGQVYQQMDKTKEAHDHYALAVKKGNLGDHPHHAYLYLAYTALELQDFDGALKAINAAAAMPDGKKDPQVKNVKDGIEATIQEHERIKAAAEASAKKI